MLEIKWTRSKEWKSDKATLVVFAFSHADRAEIAGLKAEAKLQALLTQAAADGFKGKEGESLLVRPATSTPAERLLLVGLGPRAEYQPEVLRRASARAYKAADALGLKEVALWAPTIATKDEEVALEFQALAEGLYLGAYRFTRHKGSTQSSRQTDKAVLVFKEDVESDTLDIAKKALQRARLYSLGTTFARDLINEPPSRMNPARLAEEALALAKTSSITVNVLEKKDLERLGMEAILGVGAGGAVPPRLVELVYKPTGRVRKTVALVGKGITFDSGGLSLKPAQSMETMKDDMSGAAAVLGVFRVLAELKPAVEVRGYCAMAENMPGGRAQKPGDVVKSFKGKTIEILNTDAEGRLVLADALAYACSKKPDIVIDIATLTGACVVALGHLVSGVMSNDRALSDALQKAGEAVGEKFWPLPLVKEYRQDIKSKIADLKNIGGRRGEAGTIIGGLFLQEFVSDQPWAHLDIAGPSWTDSDQPLCPTGGTGHPVRTLLRYLEQLS